MPIKDRIEQLKENAKYKKIQQHVKDNQITYSIVGGASFGIVGMLLLKGSPIGITNSAAPSIAPVFNNNNMPVISPVFNNIVNNGGYMRKIVLCLETGQRWGSVNQAAEDVGVTLHRMSQCINGHTDQIKGLHYVIDGLAAG